MGKRGNRL